ncbi:zinc-binding protein A33 [Centropristis striata]|uniref:zinc-binding protein A33 n=1 Tax=Centropristis striata TaxID=184440 RepID=UPI0027DF76E2|nr:zinc-binding protein A33 [Centropristis striata]
MYQNHSKDTNNNCNKSLLSEHKAKLIQAIKRIKHEVDECRDEERETYRESLEVENSFDVLEREIQSEFQNLHRFLDEEEWKDLERLKREREKSQVSFVPPAEVDTEVRCGQFVGPIQYRIWKHMKSCLYPNITSMTFDPETAHPNLSLSKSCTSVWFDEDKDTSGCQANPRRFHYYYSVMGRQSFTTGRHYWEVELGSKTAWRLGVAREDVPRGEMAATGTSNGFWTLALKDGSIFACTDPKPTKVNVSVRLVRLGVFLDCEKEEVAFYNAVTMAPIYTFTMEAVDVPLFPFYNPCDSDDGNNTAALKIFKPSL